MIGYQRLCSRADFPFICFQSQPPNNLNFLRAQLDKEQGHGVGESGSNRPSRSVSDFRKYALFRCCPPLQSKVQVCAWLYASEGWSECDLGWTSRLESWDGPLTLWPAFVKNCVPVYYVCNSFHMQLERTAIPLVLVHPRLQVQDNNVPQLHDRVRMQLWELLYICPR